MRNVGRLSNRRGLGALGALVLASASMAAAGPGGVAFAASKSSKTTTPPARPAAQRPAASGQIAYISDNTLEVRNQQTGQTTVDITSKTAITATVAASLKAVKSGSCITATGTKAKSGALDATTVSLVAARGANCGSGFRGDRGGGPAGGGNFRRGTTGRSNPRRSFTPPPNAATAFGKVTSLSGSKVTVEGTIFSFSGAGQSSGSKKGGTRATTPKAEKVTVDVGSKTKYLKTGPGSAKSLKVGECATAFGSTSSIGAVTATRLSVSPATSGGCGFGGFGGFGRAFFAGGGPASLKG